MEQVHPDRLLYFDRRKSRPVCSGVTHPYVASLPKVVHISFLFSQHFVEALCSDPIQRPFRTTAKFFGGRTVSRMVSDVLCKTDWPLGLTIDSENDLTVIFAIVGFVVMRTVAVDVVVHSRSEDHAGPFCTVNQDHTAVPRITREVTKHVPGELRLAWIAFFFFLLTRLGDAHLR